MLITSRPQSSRKHAAHDVPHDHQVDGRGRPDERGAERREKRRDRGEEGEERAEGRAPIAQ